MATGDVTISQAAISSCPETKRVHLMACEVDHDGEASVSSYFDTSVREEGKSSGVQNGDTGTGNSVKLTSKSKLMAKPRKFLIFSFSLKLISLSLRDFTISKLKI